MNYQDKSKTELISKLKELQAKYDILKTSYQKDIAETKKADEAVLAREKKYEMLTENMTDILWELSLDLTFTYVSAGIENLTGFLPADLIGKNVFEFIEPSMIDQIKSIFVQRQESYNATGQLKNKAYEYRQLCKNGEFIWAEAMSNPKFDVNNKLTGFQGITRDISEWKKANESLRISEETLSRVFHSSPYVITLVRLSDQKLIEVNQVAKEIVGYTREEILNDKSIALSIWANNEQYVKYLESIQKRQKLKQFELQFRTKNGELGTALMSTEFITINNELCVIGFFEVVTQRKDAEELLEESREKYRGLSEAAFDAIVITENGICLEQNLQAELLFGYTAGQAIGRNITDWIIPKDRKLVLKHMLSEYEERYEVSGLRNDGSTFPALVRARLMHYKGRTVRAISLSDITLRKTAEQKLVESEKQFSLIFENSNDAIFWAEASTGILIKCNKAGYNLVERTQEELIGKHHSVLHPPETFQKHVEEFKMHVRIKGNIPLETEVITKSGKIKIVEVSSTLIILEGKEINQGIFKDISDKKRMEEALRSVVIASAANEHGDIFSTLVMNLAKALQVTDAFIGQIAGDEKEKINTIAYCRKNEIIENFEYDLQGTPCHVVLKSGKCTFTKNLASFFPEDIAIKEQGLESYMGMLLKGSKGEHLGIISVAHDKELQRISELESILSLFAFRAASELERKQSEDTLKLSQKRLQKIADATFEGLVFTENGIIVDANQQLADMLGYTIDELIGKSARQFIAPESLNLVLQNMKSGYEGIYEHKFVKKDGSIFDVEARGNLVEYNNKMLRLTALRNITERKKSEDAIRTSRANLLALVENTTDNIWAIDTSYCLIFINAQFKREFLASYGVALLPGMNLLNTLPDDLSRTWKLRYDRAFANERFGFEEHYTFGEIHIYVEVAMNPINVDGKIIGVSVFAHDVTQRKQAEILLQEKNKEIATQNEEYLQLNEELIQTNEELIKAKEKAEESDRLKTSFLQNMSHEIRTPMNAIMGFSAMMANQYNNKPKLEQYSEIINNRCSDLLEIINDILDIAKIESAQLSINLEECNLNFLFLELMAFYKENQKRIGKDQIQFDMKVLPNAEDNFILTDTGKLKQIFMNLIGNAFKFTDSGTIEGGCSLDINNNLIFHLSDTGIGIPADKKDYIFERFAQVSHGKSRIYGGTGLGLSIAKGLVGLLGGEIWIESELGKGTTFFFSIGYTKVRPVLSPAITVKETKEFLFNNFTVLIVEDDLYNLEYLKEILAASGLTIIHTEYGKEAVHIAINQDINIILMDIRLPDIDGYEATKQIKNHKPNIKIIAQTAYAGIDDRKKAIDSGFDDYVSKPVKRELLLEKIQKHLKD